LSKGLAFSQPERALLFNDPELQIGDALEETSEATHARDTDQN